MIGVDFGGTRIKIADVAGAEVQRTVSLVTGASGAPAQLIRKIARAIRELEPTPDAVGFAIPGEVDDGGRCWRLPSVPGFEGFAIAQELATVLRCPVWVENDGTTAALAESLFGHGREYPSFAILTLGTGVGGGIVLDGEPRRGRHGFAGELGHIAVLRSKDARPCVCGERGCLESYTGTPALLAKFEELGGKAEEVRDIAESARHGERAGREVFETMGHWLAVGVASIQNVLDLDAIIFTGGISSSFDLIEPALRRTLRAHSYAQPLAEVPLLVSQLGAAAGVIGAAHLPTHFPLHPADQAS
jgi:glucokinase